MPNRLCLKWIAFVVLAVAVFGLTFLGGKRVKRSQVEGHLVSAIRDTNRLERIKAFARLRDTDRLVAAQAAAGLLDSPDASLRHGAITFLMMAYAQDPMPDDLSERLARQMRSDTDAGARLSCAIALMRVRTPTTHDAYIAALRDPHDKLVQVACMEVGNSGGPGAREALTAVLTHPSWRVRLEACKALIHANLAGPETVAALERMRQEPDAALYDTQIDEFDRLDREAGVKPGDTWGKIGTIIDQARKVAAANGARSNAGAGPASAAAP